MKNYFDTDFRCTNLPEKSCSKNPLKFDPMKRPLYWDIKFEKSLFKKHQIIKHNQI